MPQPMYRGMFKVIAAVLIGAAIIGVSALGGFLYWVVVEVWAID